MLDELHHLQQVHVIIPVTQNIGKAEKKNCHHILTLYTPRFPLEILFPLLS